jgi:type VI secretion system Hcp family effector
MTHVSSLRALAGLLFLSLAALATPSMAQNTPGLVMQVTTQQGQSFPGESSRGTGTSIQLKAWNYSVGLPTDQAGNAVGARRYKPVSIEKPIGNSSPYFTRAMLSGENLNITIDMLAMSPTGTPVLMHRVIFQNARILSVTRNGTGPIGERASGVAEMTEVITFDFQQVQFDPGRPGGSLTDDLQQQN